MRWFITPILIVLGILLMKYCVRVGTVSGPLDFAEKYLRPIGGTYGFWRLLGLAMVLFGTVWLTGIVDLNPNQDITIVPK